MPTYNRQHTITQAVDSVLEQSFKNFELIIVDDGSADKTKTKLKNIIKNKKVRYFCLKKNVGLSAARNFGIKKSKGKYIAFLDTDNIWHKNFLEVMVTELNKNPEMVMAYCGQNLFLVSDGKVIGRGMRSPAYNPDRLLKSNYLDCNSAVVNRRIIKDIGFFDEEIDLVNDWDFFVRIVFKYPYSILHINQVLVDYYYSEDYDTLTNRYVTKDRIRASFGLGEHGEHELKVIKKIDRFLKRKTNKSTLA
jgi:glycosyltransferase involved in cell wall biosynthesis